MEGLGNDFVVVDGSTVIEPQMVRSLCNRHRGVGADGVLQVTANAGVVVMGYWNADGSPAEMCGNGLRCVARYALDFDLAEGEEFEVLTSAGLRRVVATTDPTVEVGAVEVGESFSFQGHHFWRASVGNPHAVTFVEEVAAAPVATIGPALEEATPTGTNVEFIKVLSPYQLEMRVWERGVGETLACGSGMVAAAAVAVHRGQVESKVEVAVPGGVGLVELTGSQAWLTGPARYVFAGEIDL